MGDTQGDICQDLNGHSAQRTNRQLHQRHGGTTVMIKKEHLKPIRDDGEVTKSPANDFTLKRRRITRACNECRRKKIRCSGHFPCEHCTAYDYHCSYNNEPKERRRYSTVEIGAMRSRLSSLETLVSILLPDEDLSDGNIEYVVRQRRYCQHRGSTSTDSTNGHRSSLSSTSEEMLDHTIELKDSDCMVNLDVVQHLNEQRNWQNRVLNFRDVDFSNTDDASVLLQTQIPYGDNVTETSQSVAIQTPVPDSMMARKSRLARIGPGMIPNFPANAATRLNRVSSGLEPFSNQINQQKLCSTAEDNTADFSNISEDIFDQLFTSTIQFRDFE